MTPCQLPDSLAQLYESDETTWLDAMARLTEAGAVEQLDLPHLAEFLTDMARRDRREVYSRLVVLLTHLLKWHFPPEMPTRSWQAAILEQQQELRQLLKSKTLAHHAAAVLSEAFVDARDRASLETGLLPTQFPAACSWPLDEVLTLAL